MAGPGVGAGAGTGFSMSGLNSFFSDMFSGIGDSVMGSDPKQMMQFNGANGAKSYGLEGSMGSGITGTPVTKDMMPSINQEGMNQIQTANIGNTGTQGLGSKLLSPEGALAGMQVYSGIKQMNRDDEKFEIAKRNDEEDRKIARERRKGRLALGNALAQ